MSPLLCLSQSGPPSFLQPVTVQLPLPPGVTGDGACRGPKVGAGKGKPHLEGLPPFPSQASVWTAPTYICSTDHPWQPPGMTSPPRWHWNSPTCMHASRSHTSPGQCPLASTEPLLPFLCMATPQLWRFQVLALVYHQDLCGEPGPEGLGTAATAPCEPHCAAEAPRPRAGAAAVPAAEQGGGSRNTVG